MVIRCVRCSLFGHKWDGCMCSRCYIWRDEGHQNDQCHCTKCKHLVPNPQHDWSGCVCRRCGTTRDEGHLFNAWGCTLWGLTLDGQPEYPVGKESSLPPTHGERQHGGWG